MAKMYPNRLRSDILDTPGRRAECDVYRALSLLPDSYTIYYSTHWISDPTWRGMLEGEADFIITHPKMGILVIEVKGGTIHYDASMDRWYTRPILGGDLIELKYSPLEQASRSHHNLLDQLKKRMNDPLLRLNVGHIVCFPDTFVPTDQRIKSDLPREAMLDSADMANIEKSILRVFRNCFGENLESGAPGEEILKIVEALFANSFQLSTPLGIKIERQDEKLIELTEQQFRLLTFLGDRKKAAIKGCAGSGKTMLAVHKAQRFAKAGMNVLLVCFNKALAEDLSARLEGTDNLKVLHFHGLCMFAAKQTSFNLAPYNSDNPSYFTSVLPQALMHASNRIGQIYDAIIVDEGQDFIESYWIALSGLLKDDGYLYIFYDDNQNLYEGTMNFAGLIDEPAFPLTLNCRNTRMIHQKVIQFHTLPQELECPGPDGQPPELIVYKDDADQQRQLSSVLSRLVDKEQVACEDIVILTPRGSERTFFRPGKAIGNFTLTESRSSRPYSVQVSTVHGFKGLERRVVILTEVDEKSPHKLDIVLYVGCSRARTHLVVLYNATTPPEIIERLTKTTR